MHVHQGKICGNSYVKKEKNNIKTIKLYAHPISFFLGFLQGI
jgi:hypothetical protein